jgi:hypothetical protein
MATPSRKPTKPAPQGFWVAMHEHKALTWIVLAVLGIATLYESYSFWGILFLYWGISSFRTGQVFLIDTIEVKQNPVLFWVISAMWFGFGLLYVAADFLSET